MLGVLRPDETDIATMRRHGKSPWRSALRQCVRSTTRRLTRVRWQAPDDLGGALGAFRRAIRAHQRLHQLAPEFFDAGVRERRRRERAARQRWMDSWEPALQRVYGPHPQPTPSPLDELPPLPSPAVQRKVDLALAEWRFWLEAGQAAMGRHGQRHPHALLSLDRIARLMEIAMDFRRLACGTDPGPAEGDAFWDSALANLRRSFCSRNQSAGAVQGTNPCPPPPVPSPASETEFTSAASAGEVTAPTPPSGPGMSRRDAWSSWARLKRQTH